MAVPKSKWKWFGNAGHFICSRDCQFHLTTEVGEYLISTVGQYFPGDNIREILAKSRGVVLEGIGDARRYDYMKKIGYEDISLYFKYETMVFKVGTHCSDPECDCGMPIPSDWSEIDSDRYQTAGHATQGHMDMCEKWSRAICPTPKT
jgi:hypothetical protein